jgi:hypothetical protein
MEQLSVKTFFKRKFLNEFWIYANEDGSSIFRSFEYFGRKKGFVRGIWAVETWNLRYIYYLEKRKNLNHFYSARPWRAGERGTDGSKRESAGDAPVKFELRWKTIPQTVLVLKNFILNFWFTQLHLLRNLTAELIMQIGYLHNQKMPTRRRRKNVFNLKKIKKNVDKGLQVHEESGTSKRWVDRRKRGSQLKLLLQGRPYMSRYHIGLRLAAENSRISIWISLCWLARLPRCQVR